MHTARGIPPLRGSSWQDPSVLELEYVGCALEVGVVVHDRHPVLNCQYGGQEFGDAYRSMPPGPGQDALRVECTLPVATRPPVMSGSSRSATAALRIRAAALVSMRNRAITATHQLAAWDLPSSRVPPRAARPPAARVQPRSPPAAMRRGPCPTPRWCSARVALEPAARRRGRSSASSPAGVPSGRIYEKWPQYGQVVCRRPIASCRPAGVRRWKGRTAPARAARSTAFVRR
jgi:hypothetical protein